MFPGFQFRETMRGAYHMLDAPTEERRIEFTVDVSTKDVRKFLVDRIWKIEGTIDVDGIARARPLKGSLGFRLLDERRLPYRFTFVGDDGKTYEFAGQKDWSPLAPVETMEVLPATLYEGGKEVGRATLRFDARNDLVSFLRSFRLKFG